MSSPVIHPLYPAYHKVNGFTLIEVMAVVTLVAILISIAIPSFRSLMANNRVSSSSSELQALLLYARAEAVYRRTNIAVSVDAHSRHWQVWHVKEVSGNSITVTGEVLRETKLPEAVTVTSAGNTLGAAAIYFDSEGKAKPESFSIEIKAQFANRDQCLKVSAAGLIRRPAC